MLEIDEQEEPTGKQGLTQANTNLLDDLKLTEFDLLDVIMNKFNMSKHDASTQSCFVQ